MTSIVTIQNVTKRYDKLTALNNVSFKLEGGEIVALIGHNGAGKTTLMKLMLGLIQPSDGRIRITDCDPCGRKGAEIRRQIGFLPENVAFPGAMTGREIISFYSRVKGESVKKSEELLEKVGLTEACGRRVATYSKGMRQRLGLAQALIGHPRLLLLDEPTSGLDPTLRRDFYAMLEEFRRQGVAIILSSHALDEIENKADRFALIGHGCLLACDRLHQLLHRTALPVRISLQVTTCTTQRVLDAIEGTASVEQRTPDRLILQCSHSEKVHVLRKIVQLDEIVRDIEIKQPGLEALYRDLLTQQDREEVK
jgi:Cu-processing system ATP-binding protein